MASTALPTLLHFLRHRCRARGEPMSRSEVARRVAASLGWRQASAWPRVSGAFTGSSVPSTAVLDAMLMALGATEEERVQAHGLAVMARRAAAAEE